MTTSTLVEAFHSTESRENECLCSVQVNDLSRLPDEAPADMGKASRGAITGILLGASMWAAVFLAIATFRH
jgi:hypothetical protein